MRVYLKIFLDRMSVKLTGLKLKFSGTDVISRLVRGTFWSSIGALVSRLFAMIVTIIVGRLLGKEGYGEMGIVYSTMGMFGVFAGAGLGSAATKNIAEFRLTDPIRTGRIITLLTAVSLLTSGAMLFIAFLISPWLAHHSLNRPDIAPLMQTGALLLFVSTLTGVQQGILDGFESFRMSAKINLYQGIASPFITVPCVLMFGVQGAITAFTVNTALTLLMCLLAVKSELKRHQIFLNQPLYSCLEEHSILTRFALPAMLSASLTAPVTWLGNTILVNTDGGFGELGLFNAANQWRQVIIYFPALLSAAILPILSQAHGQDNKSDFKRIVVINLQITWVIALPATVFIILIGKPLANLFGRQFIGAAPMISVLMAACFLAVVNGPVGTALAGAGKLWIGTMMNLGWAVAMVIFSMILIPSFGGLGLSLAYLFAYLLHSVWQMIYVDIRLAPRAILGEWRLILFSVILLSASILISINDVNSYQIIIPLITCSTFPFAVLFYKKYLYYVRGTIEQVKINR